MPAVGSDIVQEEIVVVIEAGSTQGEGRIALVNDQTAETLKDFTVSLSIMTPNTELLAALGQPNQATVRIFDDDVPSVEFDRDVYVVVEGDRTATLKLVSTRVAAYDVGVLFDVTSLSASGKNVNSCFLHCFIQRSYVGHIVLVWVCFTDVQS